MTTRYLQFDASVGHMVPRFHPDPMLQLYVARRNHVDRNRGAVQLLAPDTYDSIRRLAMEPVRLARLDLLAGCAQVRNGADSIREQLGLAA